MKTLRLIEVHGHKAICGRDNIQTWVWMIHYSENISNSMNYFINTSSTLARKQNLAFKS